MGAPQGNALLASPWDSDNQADHQGEFLPFARPDFDETEFKAVQEVLTSGWITTGAVTHSFESEFANAVGSKHAIAVSSCTAALHLALEAAAIQPGDEVITTPYTFAATAEVIRYLGARPVFVDIERNSFNLDPYGIESAITRRTRAIIPVHIAGLPVEMKTIQEISSRHSLAIVEDAAHAFPAKYHKTMVGHLGHLTCFSFYATKTITTGEGGMITTDSDSLANRCRLMSLHGISHDAWKRYSADGNWYYEIVAPGYKYNMPDIAAALGRAQLCKANRMWAQRKAIADLYDRAFSEIPELQVPYNDPSMQHAWHLYMLRLHLDRLRIDRQRFVAELKSKGIGVSVHFIPLHIHPYYRDLYGYKPGDFPVAHEEYQREISLPIYSRMTAKDVKRVIDAVVDLTDKFRR